MRKVAMLTAIVGLATLFAACDGPGGTQPLTSPNVNTVQAFEEALWSGDVEAAAALVSDDFVYHFGLETISGRDRLREAFGGDEHHAPVNVTVESSDFVVQGDVISWSSIRYVPGSIGQAVALTATFDGDRIAELTETGARTRAEDAIGCEGSFGYSWHADYGPDASGASPEPVEAAQAAFPDAVEGVTYSEANLELEAPMSGGRGPVVRASHDGYTIGFVFLTAAADGSLLVDAVTACEGYLEPAFG